MVSMYFKFLHGKFQINNNIINLVEFFLTFRV